MATAVGDTLRVGCMSSSAVVSQLVSAGTYNTMQTASNATGTLQHGMQSHILSLCAMACGVASDM